MVDQYLGLYALVINSTTQCVDRVVTLLQDTALNHGLYFNQNSTTIYASSSDSVFSWSYSASGPSLDKASQQVLVTNMYNSDHSTRTLLIPKAYQNLLVISRGSNQNLDYGAADIAAGRAMIKIFNLDSVPANGYDFDSQGSLAGYGLRNDVGIADTKSGLLWSVQNGADNLQVVGSSGTIDIHQDEPAEKLNYIGNLTDPQGGNYGYPYCFTVWNGSLFSPPLKQYDQFTLNETQNFTVACENVTRPAYVLHPHTAPLDIKFFDGPCSSSRNGSFPCSMINQAFISLHGSWDSDPPVGYAAVTIPNQKIAKLTPSDPSPNHTFTIPGGGTLEDIISNVNISACPDGCFRPVGLAFDAYGRLWMSSDSTGEIFAISTTNYTTNDTSNGTNSGNSSGSSDENSAIYLTPHIFILASIICLQMAIIII